MINQNRETMELEVKEKKNQTLTKILAKTLTRILAITLPGILAMALTGILAMTLTRFFAKNPDPRGMKKNQMKETDLAIDKAEEDDQIEKDKENPQIKLKTENESLQIIRDTEMDVNRETLEKDNNFTKKIHGETDLNEKEAVVGEESGLKYKIPKK